MPEVSELLNEKQAAKRLGVSPHTLAVWRCERRYALKFILVGRRIRYSAEHIEEFLKARTMPGNGPAPAPTPAPRRTRRRRAA